MGYVRIDRDASTRVAHDIGKQATEKAAIQIMAKAKGLAAARSKGYGSIVGNISLQAGNMPQDTRVVLSVPETRMNHGHLEHVDVAPHLEWGYVNSRSGKHVPGKHILRDAVFG